jgi:transcriptional regulator with XRE-family HTH domain
MPTLIEKLLSTTDEGRRELARQQLLVTVSDQIWDVLEQEKTTCAELASKLRTTASNVSQMLSGRRNITLGTLADIAHELGYQARVHLRKEGYGADVIPGKWMLCKAEVKRMDAPATPGPLDKHEYATEELSWKAEVNQLSAHASKSAAA